MQQSDFKTTRDTDPYQINQNWELGIYIFFNLKT